VIGTLENLAPEQAIGSKGDVRSDIWSLGVLFYQIIADRMPFEDPSVEVLSAKIQMAVYTPLSRLVPLIPAWVDKILEKCLKRKPADRYQNTGELLLALDRALARLSSAGSAPASLPPWFAKTLRNPWAWVSVGLVFGWLVYVSLPSAAPVQDVPEPPQTTASPAAAPAQKLDGGGMNRPEDRKTQNGPQTVPPLKIEPKKPEAGGLLGPVVNRPVEAPIIVDKPVVASPPPPQPAAAPAEAVKRPLGPPISIQIETWDGSAEVYLDGDRIGATPLRMATHAGAEMRLTLKRPGYADQTVHITAGDQPGPYWFRLERK
jgi:hypothetical protein